MVLRVLLVAAVLTDGASSADLVRQLAEGDPRDAARAALDRHVELDRALKTVLEDPTVTGGHKDQVARDVLHISPVLVPRTFTDGRDPTGWDLAHRRFLDRALQSGTDAAGRLAEVERRLDPDVWQVRPGLTLLEEIVRERAGETLTAVTFFRAVDRIATFSKYRRDLAVVVDAALAAPSAGFARHIIVLAALRVSALDGHGSLTDRDGQLWREAAEHAPTVEAARLTELAALRDRWLRGPPDARPAVLDGLARWIDAGDVRPATALGARVAFKGLELMAWLSTLDDDVGTALAWIDLLGERGAADEVVAAHRVLVARHVADHSHDVAPAARDRLGEALQESLDDLESRTEGAAVAWELCRLASHRGDEEAELLAMRRAAEIALRGDEPSARPELTTIWWTPLDPPAATRVEPVESGRLASWWLAQRAIDAGRWSEALRYLGPPPPEEGCGDHIEDVATHRALLVVRCLEELGRTGEARTRLRRLAQTNESRSMGTDVLLTLVDFELRHGRADELTSWLGAALPVEAGAKAMAYHVYRMAEDAGDAARMADVAESVRTRWPLDDVLMARIGDPPVEATGTEPPP